MLARVNAVAWPRGASLGAGARDMKTVVLLRTRNAAAAEKCARRFARAASAVPSCVYALPQAYSPVAMAVAVRIKQIIRYCHGLSIPERLSFVFKHTAGITLVSRVRCRGGTVKPPCLFNRTPPCLFADDLNVFVYRRPHVPNKFKHTEVVCKQCRDAQGHGLGRCTCSHVRLKVFACLASYGAPGRQCPGTHMLGRTHLVRWRRKNRYTKTCLRYIVAPGPPKSIVFF